MKKKQYIAPEAEKILLKLTDPVLVVDDLFTGSAGEENHSGWGGAKENDDFEEAEENSDLGLAPTNPNIWGDDEEE